MSSVPTVLARILQQTREDLSRRRAALAPEAMEHVARPPGARRMRAALSAPGIGVIAEFKRRSPSAGAFREAPELAATIGAYERGGASAVSVLTEGPNFGGSLEDLRRARSLTALPLLRKDFIVDEYQLHEARAAGADAVLLIVAALEEAHLRDLHAAAEELGLDVLVEVHDEHELEVAAAAGAGLIGVNNRDLRDFSVDLARTEALLPAMPPGALVVSESGISSAGQLASLARHGVAAVLVGETLMRADDPAGALVALRRI